MEGHDAPRQYATQTICHLRQYAPRQYATWRQPANLRQHATRANLPQDNMPPRQSANYTKLATRDKVPPIQTMPPGETCHDGQYDKDMTGEEMC